MGGGGGGSGAQKDRQQEGYGRGGGGKEPRRIGCRRDMSGGSSKSAGSQSLHVIFCN